jgi:hypothetical protein
MEINKREGKTEGLRLCYRTELVGEREGSDGEMIH